MESMDAEGYILGALAHYDDEYYSIVPSLSGDDFRLESNKQMFRLITFPRIKEKFCYEELLQIMNREETTRALKPLLHKYYLSSAYIDKRFYLKELKAKSLKYKGSLCAKRYLESLEQGDPQEQTLNLMNGLSNALLGSDLSKEVSVKELIDDEKVMYEVLDLTLHPELDGRVIRTGLRGIDDILKGLRPGNLCVIGATPAVGKTAFMVEIAKNIARSFFPCMVCSMEMSQEELLKRMMFSESGVSNDKKFYDLEDEQRLRDALNKISSLPIYIKDKGIFDIDKLELSVKKCVYQHNVSCVFIDYLQLMHISGHEGKRYEEISLIARRLKELAKELKIVIVSLCQLNRAATEVTVPQKHHLRDSGEIEAAADQILLLFKQSEYLGVNIDKNRHGAENKVLLSFHKPTGIIKDAIKF